MFFSKDEVELRKVVSFYSIYTSVYFPLLILALVWSDGIYHAGKYSFNTVIFIIIAAELVKYFSSVFYLKTRDVNLSKKYDDKTASSVIRNMFNRTRIREGFKNLLVVLLMILLFFIAAVLYGAEVFRRHEETFMLSSLLSVLTILPPCMNLGSQSIIAVILGSKPINKLESLMYQNLYLTVFGAWLGAFVIPLDWDKPWQVWPIPCAFGAMVGFAVSHFFMMFKIKAGYRKKTKRSI